MLSHHKFKRQYDLLGFYVADLDKIGYNCEVEGK